MKIYLAGPVSDMPNDNAPAFAAAAAELRAAGYDVISPLEVCPEKGLSWSEYMRRDIAALVTCDGVALLAGHQNSKGATLERHIADKLDIPSDSVSVWLLRAQK